jgi:uncharacterized damage-inducible protein DinB
MGREHYRRAGAGVQPHRRDARRTREAGGSMRDHRDLLAGLLAEMTAGEPWHGPSFEDTLRDLRPEQALAHPVAGAHSVAELVRHAAAWNRIVAARLAGGEPEVDARMDWPPVDAADPGSWTAARAEFDASCLALRENLRQCADARFDPTAPGFELRATRNLHGTLAHLAWHAGQASVLRRAMGLAPHARDAD